jgi:hypothetical protein
MVSLIISVSPLSKRIGSLILSLESLRELYTSVITTDRNVIRQLRLRFVAFIAGVTVLVGIDGRRPDPKLRIRWPPSPSRTLHQRELCVRIDLTQLSTGMTVLLIRPHPPSLEDPFHF